MIEGLIAECGNHHFGDLAKAKELISAAKNSGADFAKLQAIDPDEFTGGSMPREFYRQCDLGHEGYLECVAHGDEIGIPVFFSVFGSKYSDLPNALPGRPLKISGGQFLALSAGALAEFGARPDGPVIVSIPRLDSEPLLEKKEAVKGMSLMYVSPYPPGKIFLHTILRYADLFEDQVGYSDHARGASCALQAVKTYGCRLIEKHFNIWGEQRYAGKVYRDSLHAANPAELEAIAKCLNDQ